MTDPFGDIKKIIFGGKDRTSELGGIISLLRQIHCLPEIIGREYEGTLTLDGKEIRFKFRQRPMNLSQLMVLLEELSEAMERENNEIKKASRRT